MNLFIDARQSTLSQEVADPNPKITIEFSKNLCSKIDFDQSGHGGTNFLPPPQFSK